MVFGIDVTEKGVNLVAETCGLRECLLPLSVEAHYTLIEDNAPIELTGLGT